MSLVELKHQLRSEIRHALKKLGIPSERVRIEKSKAPEFGDLSSNIAFSLCKTAKKSPLELAEEIKKHLNISRELCSYVTVTPPGFLNFAFSHDYLRQNLLDILQAGNDYGRTDAGKGKSALVEFVSANPTGPLTVGHGRQAVLGDIVSNILEWHGYHVTREYYFNDAGRQMRLLGQSVFARYKELFGQKAELPKGGYKGEYIRNVAKQVQAKHGNALLNEPNSPIFGETATKSIFEDIKATLRKIGIEFDTFVNEKTFYENKAIDKVISALKKKGLAYDQDGAIWFRTTKFGKSQDTVLMKQTGEPTYRLPDIAYHQYKIERDFDLIVDLFGADHKDTYPDVLAALESLGHSVEHIRVLIHQFVSLSARSVLAAGSLRKEDGKKVKMSTRKAMYVTLDELIDKVAPDVVRYFFIMRNMHSHLNFDLELAAKESDENPVYYLQYAHARICNIIKYGKGMGLQLSEESFRDGDVDLTLIAKPSEINLLKELIQFPEITEQALESLEPQTVAAYLQAVATHFHRFYAGCRVVTDDRPLSRARLALVSGAKVVLTNGLQILGIRAPERM